MSKLSGSKHMKASGKTQVSIYLWPDEIRQLDRIAKRERSKRASVVSKIVRNQLVKAMETR